MSADALIHQMRIGHGYDIHRIQPGGQLLLGGVVVATDRSAIAHSDGDVVIHALIDAILGAIGRGDIGEMFPDSDPALREISSMDLLARVISELDRTGFRVVNIDLTILAEQPRLGEFKMQMKRQLESVIGGQVNVKAGTNEGVGAIGKSEAIAAHAVVLLAKRDANP